MKKNPLQNPFDLQVERLIKTFSSIENFDLVQKDQIATQLFNRVNFRCADIRSFTNLVLHSYIPATNKAIYKSKQLIMGSKYKHLLTIESSDLNETLFQTIRLSYVGLFHKFESYKKDCLSMGKILMDDDSTETIENYARRKFNFNFSHNHHFKIIKKINWVSNCVKHDDGYPLQKPKPDDCDKLPEEKRLELNSDNFKADAEKLINFFPEYLGLVFVIALHKLSHGDNKNESEFPEIVEINEEAEEKKTKVILDLLITLSK